jgi:hypothetical protein
MTIQPTSRSERNRYGDHAVRVVCDTVIAPSNDTMAQLQEAMPFEAKIETSAPDNGYGRVAYVLCESASQKRRAHLAIEGTSGVAELIDQLRRWVALHSYIYYDLGQTVASDEGWDRKALQLAHLQHVHGYDAGTWHNEAFEGFTGDTGYHLPVTDEIRDQAQKLIKDNEPDD